MRHAIVGRRRWWSLGAVAVALALIASGLTAGHAQQPGSAPSGTPSAPNMPARNPWLTDSVYPTSHFNPGATDSVLFAGPATGKTLTREDVKVVSNVMVSNPAVKKNRLGHRRFCQRHPWHSENPADWEGLRGVVFHAVSRP